MCVPLQRLRGLEQVRKWECACSLCRLRTLRHSQIQNHSREHSSVGCKSGPPLQALPTFTSLQVPADVPAVTGKVVRLPLPHPTPSHPKKKRGKEEQREGKHDPSAMDGKGASPSHKATERQVRHRTQSQSSHQGPSMNWRLVSTSINCYSDNKSHPLGRASPLVNETLSNPHSRRVCNS